MIRPLVCTAMLVFLSSCSHATSPSPSSAAQASEPARDPVASFQTVRAVLQSPRCVNCHPAGDAPLQGDDSHVHLQNIQRGPDGQGPTGLSCAACHGKENAPASFGAHQPPGASSGWHLPPANMRLVFAGLGPRALCEQLKDPRRNGNLSMHALLEHVETAPLVLWGWTPGFERKPVPVAHAEFVAAFKAWSDAGGPCPGD